MDGHDEARATPGAMTERGRTGTRMGKWSHCLKALPLLAALGLGLTLAACDHCGDWNIHSCHAQPDPH